MVTFSQRTLNIIIALNIGIIIILVPTALYLQSFFKQALNILPLSLMQLQYMLGVVLIGCIFLLFLQLKKRYSGSYALSFCFILIAEGILFEFTRWNAIEYTHLILYASLTAFLLFRFPNKKCKAIFIAATVSGLDEALQGIHPERFCDFHDFILNGIGILTGFTLAFPFFRKPGEARS